MDEQTLSTRDAAKVLGVEPTTLKKWRLEGRGLPWVEVSSRKAVYRRKDLEQFLDERTRRPRRR